jgi:hypothetical protein
MSFSVDDAITLLESADINKLTETVDEIRNRGLNFVFALASAALSRGCNSTILYFIFSKLSTLLHPHIDHSALTQLITTLLPIAAQRTELIIHIAFGRCLSTACLHLLTPDTLSTIQELITSMPPNLSMAFISELTLSIRQALDVPILATINFLIATQILGPLLPSILNAFFSTPIKNLRDIIEFYVIQFSQPALLQLANEAGILDFDVNAYRQELVTVFSLKLPQIPELYGAHPEGRLHILAFIEDLMVFRIDSESITGIVHEILASPVDFGVTLPMLNLLQSLLLNYKTYHPPDIFIEYVWQIASGFMECGELLHVSDALQCMSKILCRETTEIPRRSDPRIQALIPRLVQLELQFDFDKTEDHPDLRDNIVELEVFICGSNPGPAIEVIMSAFSDTINISIFHWCLKFLNGFARFYVDIEESPDCFIPMLTRIIRSPLLGQFVQKSPLIACELCQTYEIFHDPDGALAAFRMALELYPSDDDVMRLAVKLAQNYHFPIDSIASLSARMSYSVVRMAVSLAPNDFVHGWVLQLLAEGTFISLSTAAAVIRGLLDIVYFDVEPFLEIFVSQHLFRDAINISHKNPLNFARVLEAAMSWQTDHESSLALFRTVLKVAKGFLLSELTDLVLKVIPPEDLTDYKVGVRVSTLLCEHAISSIPLTPDSVIVLVNCLGLWLSDSIALTDNVSEGLIRAFSFSFQMAYPLISNELWALFIPRLLNQLMRSPQDVAQGSDILFKFAKLDIERYLGIMQEVLSQASNPDILLDLLHGELFARSEATEVEQMTLFERKLRDLAKTYWYLKKFV